MFEGLLHHSASVHLEGEVEDMSTHEATESLLLERRAVFKELLDHIVAKDIGHEIEGVGEEFCKGSIPIRGRGDFQALLDETRTVLVDTQAYQGSGQFTEFNLASTARQTGFDLFYKGFGLVPRSRRGSGGNALLGHVKWGLGLMTAKSKRGTA
jgi:hypothetical protein